MAQRGRKPAQSNKKVMTPSIIFCANCEKEKKSNDFYASSSVYHANTCRVQFCKVCCVNMSCDKNGNIIIEKLKELLQKIDKPFLEEVLQSSYEESKNRIKDNGSESHPLQLYFKTINSLPQYKNFTWKDSIFEQSKIKDNDESKNNNTILNNENFDLEKLKEKFGYGYPDNEYLLFEKKYQTLRPSVKVLTTLHDEFFREYCVDKVKETLAKAQGNFKEAKEWASMAKDAATAGKLNPNQMSKADLSGGMDTFGQMSRMVEETEKGELVSILPKFINKPKDKVDVVLWSYINYIRDIKGLPECEYKDIYEFYEIRKKSYESQMLDNELNKNEGVEEYE